MNGGTRGQVQVHFRIPKEKADRLKALARATDRPLSQLINRIISKYLEHHANQREGE